MLKLAKSRDLLFSDCGNWRFFSFGESYLAGVGADCEKRARSECHFFVCRFQFWISVRRRWSLSGRAWMREGLGELLLEPLIDHFPNGPSLLTSAAHVLCAGHDPGHLWLARG
jgi:hypothetical protein